jgi:hypothetical protein
MTEQISIRRSLINTRKAVCVLALMFVVCAAGPNIGMAQPEVPKTTQADKTDAPKTPTTTPKPTDVVYLIDEKGNLVKVLAGETMKEFREFVRQKSIPRDVTSRDYSISNISIKGEVLPGQERAKLTVDLDLTVHSDTEVRIPLQMTEATLLGQSYEGAGSLDFERVERTNSVTCLVKGAGDHHIELSMLVPIRKAANSNRLQLTLPSSFINSLTLKVPQNQIQLRTPQQVDWQAKTLDDGTSEITVNQVGAKVDLTWQTVPDQKKVATVLRSQTYMSALGSGEEVQLEAMQVVTATQGSFKTLKVTVPAGFSVLDIQCPTIPNLGFDQKDRIVIINLDEVSTSRVELHWSLNLPSVVKNEFTIASLNVEGCKRNSGMLGLKAAEGFRLRIPKPDPLTQIGVNSFRALTKDQFGDQDSLTHAFRFPSESFEIKVEREPVASSYTVEPTYDVRYSETWIELNAKYDVEVFRGTVKQLQLTWPRFVEDGWEIVDVVGSPDSIDPIPPSEDGQPVILDLADAKDRTHGRWQFQLRCRKQVATLGEDFTLNLPMPDAPRTPPGHLTFRNADRISNETTPHGETLASVVRDPQRPDDPSIPANQIPVQYEIEGDKLQFQANVRVHEKTIEHDVVATVTIDEEEMQVRQQFNYVVSYERVSQILVSIPNDVKSASFWLEDRETKELVELSAQATAFEQEGGRKEYRVSLTESLWGSFRVICQYSLAHSTRLIESQSLDATLLLLADNEDGTSTLSTRLQIRSPDNMDVELPAGDLWKPELASVQTPTWIANGKQLTVPMKLSLTPDRAAQNFSVSKAAIRTRFQHGLALSQAVYLIEGDVAFLSVAFPAEVNQTNLRVWWDGVELDSKRFRPAVSRQNEFRIVTAGATPNGEHFLAIEFTSTNDAKFDSLNRRKLPAPSFARDVWIAETMWDVVLPFDQHMFAYPENYLPRFTWQRNAVIWNRQPIDRDQRLLNWLTEGMSPSSRDLVPFESFSSIPFGNSYLFTAFGHQNQISFQAMSQPAIILIGAGFALAMGFVLVRIPATRHVLTFLTIGFLMALLGLWKLEPVQLLIQPAIFGLLLAVVGATVEAKIKRGQQATSIASASPQEFLRDSTASVVAPVEGPVSESA